MSPLDEALRYTIRADKTGIQVDLPAAFWAEGTDARLLDRRILIICGEVQAALHAVAAANTRRH